MKNPKASIRLAAGSLVLAGGLAACGGGDGTFDPVPVGDTIVVTESGNVQSFNRASPGTLVGSRSIGGLASGETVLGIDYRPANGLLYALGSRGNLYTLDPATGRAIFRAELKAASGDDQPFISLAGTQFGVDFNPVADRLRLVSNTGQNLRINVETGDTTTDGSLQRAGEATTAVVPNVTAAAYTQSFKGSTATKLYVLDLSLGQLLVQDPPNNGTLASGVPLGLVAGDTPGGVNGFDIEARGGAAYAVIRSGGAPALYRIDLAAAVNAATRVGALSGTEAISGLALVQPD